MSRLPTAAEDAAWTPYGDGSEESIVHLAPESEQQVLGSLLLLPEVLPEVKRIVRPADFFEPIHRAAYRAILELDAAGLPLSTPLLLDRTRNAKEFSKVDPVVYWLEVGQSVATAAHAAIYAAQVVEARRKRQRVDGLEAALVDARNGHTSERVDQYLFSMVDDWKREREAETPRDTFTFADLSNAYPQMKPPLIDGLVRIGEVMNIIANTKVGKSWFLYDLALSIVTGRYLFGRLPCTKGKVLICDNELHGETLASRLPFVAHAKGIDRSEYEHNLIIKTLRGNLRDFNTVAAEIREQFAPGELALVAFDAKYRFTKPGQSENDNASEAAFYNDADKFAEAMQCTVAFVHHATKGPQSDKRVSDVGAGAGSQSRAADVHAVFREHEDDGAFVFEALVRSFPPVEPIGLKWQFPLWIPDSDVDPGKLKGRLSARQQQQSADDQRDAAKIVSALTNGPATSTDLGRKTGISRERRARLLDWLESEGQIQAEETMKKGNVCRVYSLPQ